MRAIETFFDVVICRNAGDENIGIGFGISQVSNMTGVNYISDAMTKHYFFRTG